MTSPISEQLTSVLVLVLEHLKFTAQSSAGEVTKVQLREFVLTGSAAGSVAFRGRCEGCGPHRVTPLGG